jgi:hypothetical protein
MKTLRLLSLAACVGTLLIGAACGDDEALVRLRLDSGVTAPPDAGNDAALACGAVLPLTYESPAFAANVAIELAFTQRVAEIDTKMKAAEGASDAGAPAADLKAIFNAGAPSLRAVSTTAAQSIVDSNFDAFEAALGKEWKPVDAEQDGGAPAGGKYGEHYFSATGVDLRQVTTATILGGTLYNYVLGLVAAPVTDATIDRLLAAFGASPAFAHSTNADAGADADRLVAALAADRDDPTSATPGPYRKVQASLFTMKAAVAAGDKCKTELDAAVATYLLEWERATYASAIHYLNAAAVTAADPLKGSEALHAFGEALGLIQSFKGLPERRKITDAQIDALLAKIGDASAFQVVTRAGDRALKLNEAINDIALYERFAPAEVEAFRK